MQSLKIEKFTKTQRTKLLRLLEIAKSNFHRRYYLLFYSKVMSHLDHGVFGTKKKRDMVFKELQSQFRRISLQSQDAKLRGE